MHCAEEDALLRSRSTGSFAIGALMALAAGALAREAHAQSTASPFQPSLSDPRHPQRFGSMLPASRRLQSASAAAAAAAAEAAVASAGETGFDSTGAVRKRRAARRKPGSPHPLPPQVPPPPNAAQGSGHNTAPQFSARAPYAEIYRAPDALPRPRRPARPADEPFDPLGIRVGTFIVKPAIEVTRAYDSNAERFAGGRGSPYTITAPELSVRSQWPVHELTATLRGTYSTYDNVSTLNRPSADGKVNARIDAARDLRYDVEGRFILGTDNPGSPNLQAGLSRFPIFTTLGTTVGATKSFNRLELTLKGSFDRTVYQASHLTDGTTSSNDDRNFDQYGATVRAAYEVTPGIKPFVEVFTDRRIHQLALDRNGEQRDSSGVTPRVGGTFELSRILTGELSVGYQMRRYKDPGLPDLSGMVADASLKWAATGLTTATLTASSRTDETILANTSGTFRRDVGLQIDHAFRRWLLATIKLGVGYDRYVGFDRADTRTSIGTALTYKFNRELWFKGEYRNERLHSNVASADYNAHVWLFGLRLQR